VLSGTFDVRNYGDLLFPLLAAHRLEPHEIRLRPASPTGRDTGWRDAVSTEPLPAALYGPQAMDGVLIGGGNIIHARSVTLPDYAKAGVADWAYGGLWLGATLAAARRRVPVAWNAPGVPHGFDLAEQPVLHAALQAASHLAVRDDESAAFLAPGVAQVVPDTALGLAALWPRKTLEPVYRQLLERTRADLSARFVAIHVKGRSVDGPPESIAPLIDAFSEASGCVPLIVALGQCHEDHLVTARICAALKRPHLDLSEPLGLREIASAIAFSAGYVGASMHGYITAAAYGVRGIIVGRPALPKMQGLLAHLGRRSDEVPDWRSGLDAMVSRMAVPCGPVPSCALAALDTHWRAVAEAFHSRRVDAAAQGRFLDLVNADEARGQSWLAMAT